jgi:hypothetical protein
MIFRSRKVLNNSNTVPKETEFEHLGAFRDTMDLARSVQGNLGSTARAWNKAYAIGVSELSLRLWHRRYPWIRV